MSGQVLVDWPGFRYVRPGVWLTDQGLGMSGQVFD